jgi:uncharacterized delta-60 repeat protein
MYSQKFLRAKHRLALLALAMMLAPTLSSAQTAPSVLDASFGTGGKVTADFGGPVALQQDGKIVAAGRGLARFNPNGTLDNTFGTGGKTTIDVPASTVAIQMDGKIVTAGTVVNPSTSIADFALARYNPNGTLDTSFGAGGKVTTDFSGVSANAYSIALQRDGKIVVAGVANIDGGEDFALARYNPNGSPDLGFGTDGKVTTDFGLAEQGFSYTEWGSVAIQGDGKIVVAGRAYISSTGFDLALARYNPNGTLDTSFGTGGKVTTDFGTNYDGAFSLALQQDGKIIVAGQAVGRALDFLLVRYNTNGTLDNTFGTGGKVLTDFAGSDAAFSVAIRSDGKIVAAGRSFVFSTGNYDFAVARYNSNGTLDTSFGTGGKVTTDFLGDDDNAFTVVVQPDGKAVVAGSAFDNSTWTYVFAMARYN